MGYGAAAVVLMRIGDRLGGYEFEKDKRVVRFLLSVRLQIAI